MTLILTASLVLTGFGRATASDVQPGKDKPLRIAVYKDYAPFSFISASGNLTGLFIDFWQLFGEHNKTQVEFVPTDWPGTLEAVKTGKADVHSGLFKNPDREAWLAFSAPIFETNTSLYYRAKDQAPASLDDLTGTRVGVIAGSHQLSWLKKNHPGVQAVEFPDTAPALRALLRGDIRALFNETPSTDVEIARLLAHGEVARIPKDVLSNTVHAGVLLSNPSLAARIEQGMANIPLSALADAERRWLSNPADRYWERRKDTLFTPEQRTWLATKPVIRLAVTDFIKPVDIVDSQGRYSGFNADLMALLGRRIGVQVVPVFHKTWTSVVERAMSGEVDGALSLSYSPERAESLLFTSPYAYDPIIAVTKAGRKDVAAWEDLAGKRVTLPEKTPMEKRIRELVKDGSVEIVKDNREGLTKVQEGAADVHVTWLIQFGNTQRHGRIPNLQVALSEDAEGGDFRIGVHKSRPMVADVLARGLRQISEEELAALRRKWFSVDEKDEGGLVLTDAEKAWLEAHKTIRVGLASNRPPLESKGPGGGYEGFNVDILRIVSGLMNVSMAPVEGLSWDEILKKATDTQLDVVASAGPTPDLKGSLIFTKPFQKFRMIIVTAPQSPEVSYLAELGGKSVGVLRGSPAEAALASDFPDVKAVAFDSILDGLKAVEAKRIDAYVGNGVAVSYLMAKHGLENLRQSVAEQPYLMRMGVRADWPELVVILNKAIAAISDNDRDAILHAWTNLRVERSTDWGMVIKVALGLLSIGAVITTIILVANRKLSMEVAERKKAEKAIVAAEAEMTQIFNTSAGGMRVIGKDFTVLKVNDAFLELSGFTREELVGSKCHEHFGGMECDTEDCTLRRILEGEPRVEGTVVKQHKDGMPIYCDVAATPFLAPDGEILGVIEDFRDMTERMKAQHLIKQSENKYRELVESASSIILKLDMEGNITFFNEFAQKFFGFTPDEIIGKPIVGTIVPETESGGRDLAALIAAICANPEQYEKNENENICKDGRRVWISWTNKVIRDDVFNNPKGLLCIGLDASERKKAQDGLHEALEIISGSIRYASRIQRAILPPPETFRELMPSHFAVWEPRDVVGGDIYWIRPWGEGVLLILADCTGHGVPGAFITLIGSGALDRAVAETPPGDPAALIALMNKYVKVVLSQELQYGQEDSSDDGLELGVCYIPPDRKSLVFAGAHFQLFTVNGGEVEIVKGGRKGIGYRFVSFDATYENQTVPAKPGQRFYMTTDGLIDQIGGEPRRSFGKKRFTDLLASLKDIPLSEQGAIIFDAIEKHRGEESRRDDISVIGFEL